MRIRFFYIVSLFTLLIGSTASAQGDLMVMPTRVTIDGTKRFEVLTVLNRGTDSAQYTISFLQYRMTPQGDLQEITDAEAQMKASEFVRFFPKQVYLAPGESQTVRIQVTKPEGLAEGEYRSHLYFRSVPKDEPATSRADSGNLSVRLTPVFGISIPVIVRHGDLNASVTMRDAKVVTEPTGKMLTLSLERSGERSVYGDMHVDLRKPNGETRNVSLVRGISVYTPNTSRGVRLPIQVASDEKGTLVITYKQKIDGKETVLAESQAELQ
jgi:P pilus assembly chaperone PapD